jgi:RHS repeat-associated protein
LESRWAYASEDVGTAGTVYVNLYNGKHVLTGPGLSTQDEILPLSVYPVYNGYLSGLQFTPNTSNKNAPITANFNATAGYGFKLSCWESLTFKTISGISYVCYNDADGTELYFRHYPDLGYLSEDGYDLKFNYVLINPFYYSISDSNGNVKYFDINGRLSAILDEYGNKKIFNYDASNRLESISFQSKTMASAEPQLTFTYNSGNALERITNAKDTSVYLDFYYSSTRSGTVSQDCTGYLRKIQYSNNDFAEYQYDSSDNLYRIRQGNGGTYGVYAWLFFGSDGRVSELRQYGSDGYLGNKATFEYDHKKAVIRTAGKDDIPGNTDDLLSVYLFDNYGNTVCSYLTDLDGQTVYGASSAEYTALNVDSNPKSNNSVVKTGGKGQYSKNLISNGNLEYTSGWTQTLSYVSCNVSSTEYLFGTKSVYLSGNSSICSGTLSQNVTISEPGTYTLSAYVKSTMSMGYPTTINGAYIALDGTKSDIISGATDVNVQNGWRKLSVTKTFASAGTYTVELALRNMYGAVYFDGVSLIKGDAAATEFNYLSNSWIQLGTVEPQTDGSVKLSCTPGGSVAGYALVNLNKPAASSAFVLSGWSKGYSVPEEDTTQYPDTMTNTHQNRFWGIEAIIYYAEGGPETQRIRFNPAVSGEWQYASGVIMPSQNNLTKTVTSVWIYLRYDNNANYAFFKDISFTETDAAAYEYDANGNVIKARNTENNSSLTYSGTDLTGITDSQGNSISYTYVSNKHKVLTATDAQGITATYGYNTNGLATSAIMTPSSGSGQISSSAVYNNYGHITSETDTLGHTTSYGYNTDRGLLNYITNANNHRTQYVYDLGGKLTEIYADINKNGTHDSSEAGVDYTYNAKNYLTEIYNGATTYHFAYDNYGNVTSVTIGENTAPLVSYSYASRNGKLLSTTYADGTVISNIYDNLSRVKSVSYNGVVAYTATYDGNGNIDSYTDCATGRVYRYEYDALGREIRYFVTLNGSELFTAEKSYDSSGRSVGYRYSIGSIGARTSSNTYDQYNRLSQETTAGGDTVRYFYDGFGRVISKTEGNYTYYYEYVTNGTNTSTLVSKLTLKHQGITVRTVQYTYDNLGNILTEDDGVTYRHYTYDSLNQLQGETYYDKASGLGEGRMYFISKSGNVSYVSYEYNNGVYGSSHSSGQSYGSGTDWKELMTSFAGIPITYDANGNPLSYYNGQSYTFTWQKGRQLASAVTGTNIISYTYDVNGLRIGKTVNGTAHTYTYDGSLLLCDKWGSQYIEYFYDASGSPYALNYYNGSTSTKYFFVKNIEGDILELRGSTNALVAKYIYDGWGKLLEVRDSSGNAITSSTHIANLNVLRYRGYFYDAETKLYYLQSRYYDPQTQRFINPDAYVSTGQGIIGHNMFAYCNNNPANKEDSYGEDAIWIQEGNSAGGFGHSGLLVQDSNGKWFYFYWGPIKEKEKNIPFLILGVQNGAYLIPCDRIKGDLHYTANVVETVLGAFVEYNTNHKKEKKENRAFLITSTYYFSGDYTATYNYCKKISSERNLYRLLNYNCFQITWNAMAESNKAFTKKHYFIPNNHMIEIFYLSDRFVQPYSVSFFASKNHTHSFLSFK